MIRIVLLSLGALIGLAVVVTYWQVAIPVGVIGGYVWLRRRYNRQQREQPAPTRGSKPKGRAPKLAVDVVELPTWFSVAGESHRSDNGSDRQEIIAKCKVGTTARLVREPKNKYDSNAVAVVTPKGQVGYLARADATVVAPLLDSDMKASATIAKIVGGTPDKPSRGVFVEVDWD